MGRKDSLGVGENGRALGIHHRCVKMLVRSKCLVSGHAHGCGRSLCCSAPDRLRAEAGEGTCCHPDLVLPGLCPAAPQLHSLFSPGIQAYVAGCPLTPSPHATRVGKPDLRPVLDSGPGQSWGGLWKTLSHTVFAPSWGLLNFMTVVRSVPALPPPTTDFPLQLPC